MVEPQIHLPAFHILKGAVEEALGEYQKGLGRPPTTKEWELLFSNAIDRLEIGVVKSVTIDLAEDDGD